MIDSHRLDLQSMNEYGTSPVWISLYLRPQQAVGQAFLQNVLGALAAEKQDQTEYAGRILMQWSVTKVNSPVKAAVNPGIMLRAPDATEVMFFAELYQINLPPEYGAVSVEVSVGAMSVETPLIHNEDGVYLASEQTGTLPPLRIQVPSLTHATDLFMYIKSSYYNLERIAFVRLPLVSLSIGNMEWLPEWIGLRFLEFGVQAQPQVLISLASSIIDDDKGFPARQPRVNYSIESWEFRAYVYQGLNFPTVDDTHDMPDCFVKISLGGASVQTAVHWDTPHPDYFAAFQVQVALPTELSIIFRIQLATNIVIEVYHGETNYLLIGRAEYAISKVPTIWTAPPAWVKLQSTKSNFINVGEVLCAFELSPLTAPLTPLTTEITTPTLEALVLLHVIGVRTVNQLERPHIKVFWGRDALQHKLFLWEDETDAISTGEGNNWNFLDHFKARIPFPQCALFNSCIEMMLYDVQSNAFGGTVHVPIGHAFVHVASLMPWISAAEKRLSSRYRTETLESDRLAKATAIKKNMRGGEAAMTAFDEVVNVQLLGMVQVPSPMKKLRDRQTPKSLQEELAGIQKASKIRDAMLRRPRRNDSSYVTTSKEKGKTKQLMWRFSVGLLKMGSESLSSSSSNGPSRRASTASIPYMRHDSKRHRLGSKRDLSSTRGLQNSRSSGYASQRQRSVRWADGPEAAVSAAKSSQESSQAPGSQESSQAPGSQDSSQVPGSQESFGETVLFVDRRGDQRSDSLDFGDEADVYKLTSLQEREKIRQEGPDRRGSALGGHVDNQPREEIVARVQGKGATEPSVCFDDDELNLVLALALEDNDEEEAKAAEVDVELEQELKETFQTLPYINVPLLHSTSQGLPRTEGVLRLQLQILTKDDTHLKEDFVERCHALEHIYETIGSFVVRVYVLGCRGLVPPSMDTILESFIVLQTAPKDGVGDTGFPYRISDTQNVRVGLSPEVNKCYQLHINFPTYSSEPPDTQTQS
ncbi:MAG: hypothetical protein KVP17_004853 [Porospora cf. gigantea B]|uniref:uncharacterized protein n=1 Tax=Porospora cf. gigantea B TaxID=2853592 RepID=UPI003571BD9C|nr:MAG: hypothetical protein KVP17_004853 [Porospora cf. gigantea B]